VEQDRPDAATASAPVPHPARARARPRARKRRTGAAVEEPAVLATLMWNIVCTSDGSD